MARSKRIRIAITGGGSGGHIYPLISVARELRNTIVANGFDADIRYFGNPGAFRFLLEEQGIPIQHIASSKWRRYADVQNVFDIFRFLWSIPQALWKLYWFMPHICFSKGGPGAFSVILAARFYLTPLAIHESDAIPGRTTMLSASRARIIELAFNSAAKYFKRFSKKLRIVGNPIRSDIELGGDTSALKQEFGFSEDIPLILFIGGSQGARSINNFVMENIVALTEKFQILHQTGIKEFNTYKQEYAFMVGERQAAIEKRYQFVPYFQKNVGRAYGAADLIVGRAGASTIFEIAALGKPSILVPLPESARNHQWQNAQEYAGTGAAIVIEEENLLVNVFIATVEKLLGDEVVLTRMREAATKFATPGSSRQIADDIVSLLPIGK